MLPIFLITSYSHLPVELGYIIGASNTVVLSHSLASHADAKAFSSYMRHGGLCTKSNVNTSMAIEMIRGTAPLDVVQRERQEVSALQARL